MIAQRKDVNKMKMTKRAINVTVFTVIALMLVLVFGYSFRFMSEINAMDLGNLTADKMGKAATDITVDESKADADEIAAVKKVETVLCNCMSDQNVIGSVKADYENHRIVYLILADGAANAAKSGDADEWSKVRELGETASLEGEEILEGSGLEGWDFDVEILNDVYPVNAMLTFDDGECTYDCLAK